MDNLPSPNVTAHFSSQLVLPGGLALVHSISYYQILVFGGTINVVVHVRRPLTAIGRSASADEAYNLRSRILGNFAVIERQNTPIV
jgi:hypothetical protein